MGLLSAIAALPTGLFACLFERWHRIGIWMLTASLVALVWFFLGPATTGKWAMSKRMEAFGELAGRLTPLVQAIQRYQQDHGKPPDALEELIPDYIPSVPSTGMPAYKELRYHTGDEAKDHEDNPWVLTIFCTSGGINFDQFMYFPRQNYPSQGYGGSLERVRDWAYVHE